MSWNVNVIGRPDKVAEALDKYRNDLKGQSRFEYEEALPHLKGLVEQNVSEDYLVKVEASGHASLDADGKKTFGICHVSIKQFQYQLAL